MDYRMQLKRLFDQYGPLIKGHPWTSEDDRWAELVFCLLLQCSQKDAKSIRLLVTDLRKLSLLDIDRMVSLDDPANQTRVVFVYMLQHHMFAEGTIAKTCTLLAHVARHLRENYDGKIQRFLRHHGEAMRDELVGELSSASLNESILTAGITLWLQNVLSIPISFQPSVVSDFCRANSISPEDLWEASDAMNLNLAVVDDLLEIASKVASLDAEMAEKGETK